MPSVSAIAVSEGSGKNISTQSRTISALTRDEQIFLPGEPFQVTYTAIARDISIATSADHVLFVQADGTNICRLVRMTIAQSTLAGAVGTADFRLMRTTTAGSGGTTVNGRPFDDADTDPYGGTAQTLPTSKGTEGNQLLQRRLGLVATNPMDARNLVEWLAGPRSKPILFGTATTKGLAVKIATGIATAKVDVELEFTVTTFV